MAKQKSTPFTRLVGLYQMHRGLSASSIRVKNGGHLQELPELAMLTIASNGDLEDTVKREMIDRISDDPTNTYHTFPALEMAVENSAADFGKYLKENLEDIAGSTNVGFLQEALTYVTPSKTDTGNKEYNAILKLHKEVNGMKANLDALANEGTDDGLKKQILGQMSLTARQHYEVKYKGKDDALRLLRPFLQFDKEKKFAQISYQGIFEEKKKELGKQLKGKTHDYLKSALKDEEVEAMYETMLEKGYDLETKGMKDEQVVEMQEDAVKTYMSILMSP